MKKWKVYILKDRPSLNIQQHTYDFQNYQKGMCCNLQEWCKGQTKICLKVKTLSHIVAENHKKERVMEGFWNRTKGNSKTTKLRQQLGCHYHRKINSIRSDIFYEDDSLNFDPKRRGRIQRKIVLSQQRSVKTNKRVRHSTKTKSWIILLLC